MSTAHNQPYSQNNLSTWSIRNPLPTLMFFIVLTIAGLVSYRLTIIQLFPDLELPMITVTTTLPGAAASQMETEVAKKIEDSVSSIDLIKHIYSTAYNGAAVTTIQFELDKPTQEAVDDVKSAIDRIRSDLPDAINEPIVTKVDLAGSPITAYTVDAPQMNTEEASWFMDNTLQREMLSIKGVGAAVRVGGADREVQVVLDIDRLRSLGLTADAVSQQIKMQQIDGPSGSARLGDSRQNIRTYTMVRSAAELGNFDIMTPGGSAVKLNSIAAVKDTIAETESLALLDGKPVVSMEITASKGNSVVTVGGAVREKIEELRVRYPDVTFTEAFDFVTPVRGEFDSSMTLLYEGALLAIIVVYLFLRNWRATIISSLALPLSIIPACLAMYALGYSFNMATLLALALVVGILVDDAIVEVENIVRHMRMGKTPFQAALDAATEIGLAVIATTFTIIAVFVPTAFMSGIPGRMFAQFSWTAVFAIFSSLLVARMLTPMMAAYFFTEKDATQHKEGNSRVMQWYLRVSDWCLRHRFTTLFVSLVLFAASLSITTLLPSGFIPPDDQSQTQVSLELSPGTQLQETTEIAERARQLLMQVDGVKSIYTTIGGGAAGADVFMGAGAQSVRKAMLTITLNKRGERRNKQDIQVDIREVMKKLPGARITVGLAGSGEKYMLSLSGEEEAVLSETARKVQQEIATIRQLGNVSSSAALVNPEIVITPDLNRAASLGISSAQIANTLRIATTGDYDSALPKMNTSQRQVPIVIKLDSAVRTDIDALKQLTINGSKGPVLLGQIAELELTSSASVIKRHNRKRNIQLEVDLNGVPLGEAAAMVDALPTMQNLPSGIEKSLVGDAEAMEELFQSFALALAAGILCIYLVLVLLFRDVFQPITILAALPLSVGGAFLALLATHSAISMAALIGLLMLMGIATKNSILLVEYAIVNRRSRGMNRHEALLDACHKRARPIIMTTIAMGAGMMPVAIGLSSADQSFRSPMAITVIGGLITSTFLSLLVIPAVYTCMDDIGSWLTRLLGRGLNTAPQPGAQAVTGTPEPLSEKA